MAVEPLPSFEVMNDYRPHVQVIINTSKELNGTFWDMILL